MLKIGHLVIEIPRLLRVLIVGILIYLISVAFVGIFPPFPGWAVLIVSPVVFTVLSTSAFEGLFRSKSQLDVRDFTFEITNSDGSKESTKITTGDSDSVRKAAEILRDRTS